MTVRVRVESFLAVLRRPRYPGLFGDSRCTPQTIVRFPRGTTCAALPLCLRRRPRQLRPRDRRSSQRHMKGCRARDVSVNADVPASGGTASATAKRVPRDQTRTHSKTFESPAGIERRTCFTGAEPHSALCADTHCRGVHDESRFQRVSVEGEPVEAFMSSCPPSRSPTTSVEVSTGSVRSPAGLFHTMRRDRAAQR